MKSEKSDQMELKENSDSDDQDTDYPSSIEKDSDWLAQLDSDGDGKNDVFQQSSCTTKLKHCQSFTFHVLYCAL